jgi:hypothetical protein
MDTTIKVYYMPATWSNGSKYKVKGKYGVKKYSFPYDASDPRLSVVQEYLAENTSEVNWSIREIDDSYGYAEYECEPAGKGGV